jgi:hypothetical protein
MNSTRNYNQKTQYRNRKMRRRSNRITKVTVITTAVILACSVTVIAAPMKQNAVAKVSLPSAGIGKIVSDYTKVATESEISVLASDIFKSASASDQFWTNNVITAADNNEAQEAEAEEFLAYKAATLDVPEPVYYEEPVYEEPVYEEPVYEEPVYEEPVYEEPMEVLAAEEMVEIVPEEEYYEEEVPSEEYYEEEVPAEEYYEEEAPAEEYYEEEAPAEEYFEEEVPSEEYYEEVPAEEYYEEEAPAEEVVESETEAPTEPIYEEETLEEFYEEQDRAIEEQAEQKAEQQPVDTGAYLGQTIANDACQYVGVTPYVWAGCSLESGTDCSGFTMLIYAKYGYELSHDSNVQSCQGTHVDLSSALPGDIVVYAGHVAMYIGNGQVVHCPQPGEYVSIASVNMMPVLDVRRIIG